MLISICKRVLLAGLATISFVASAQEVTSPLLQLQHQWAHVNYNLEGDAQHDAFISLIEDAKQLAEKAQNSASSLTWLAISQSSAASAKGGLGALDYAKNAKDNLERAIEKDASVLDGTALTVLAALYHKVPGWPVSFGSDTEAEALFKRALKVNPNGMDQNFFYAEYLFDENEFQEALKHLALAESAPAKQNRPLADKKRREEIAALKEKIGAKL
jgi:hypothetical protein